VKQALDAHQPHPDADFKIDGDTISQITFVGQIRSMATQTTNITYKVDDGTGIIEVKQWVDGEAANPDDMDTFDPQKPKLVENGYCRVWGRMKAFNGKRHVGAHVIRPITDFNEVNYHLLEATAIHLYFTRGPPAAPGQNGQANGTGNGSATNAGNQSSKMIVNGKEMPEVSASAWKIYCGIKDTGSNEGLHTQMIASQMGMQVADVCKGAEELASKGYIYTTVDDDTWAALEM
jgi:replication factor A2